MGTGERRARGTGGRGPGPVLGPPAALAGLTPEQRDELRRRKAASMLAAMSAPSARSPLESVAAALAALTDRDAVARAKNHTAFAAAALNRVDVLRHLLRQGATLDWPYPVSRMSLLHAACGAGAADAVRVLLLADRGKIRKLWEDEVDDCGMEGCAGYLEVAFHAARNVKAVRRPQRAVRALGSSDRPPSTLGTGSDAGRSADPSSYDARDDDPAEDRPECVVSALADEPPAPSATLGPLVPVEKRTSGSLVDTDGTVASRRNSVGAFDDDERRLSGDFESKRWSAEGGRWSTLLGFDTPAVDAPTVDVTLEASTDPSTDPLRPARDPEPPPPPRPSATPRPPSRRRSTSSTLVSSASVSSLPEPELPAAPSWLRLLDMRDHLGRTPLHCALLGAAGLLPPPEEDRHALPMPPASGLGDYSLAASVLCREWPRTHLYLADSRGDLPIHLACRLQLVHLARVLLDAERMHDRDAELGRDADWEGEMWARRSARGLCAVHEALLGGMQPAELVRRAGFDLREPRVVGPPGGDPAMPPLPSALLRVLLRGPERADAARMPAHPPRSRFSRPWGGGWYERLTPLNIVLLRIRAGGWDENAAGCVRMLLERGAEIGDADRVVFSEMPGEEEVVGMEGLRELVRERLAGRWEPARPRSAGVPPVGKERVEPAAVAAAPCSNSPPRTPLPAAPAALRRPSLSFYSSLRDDRRPHPPDPRRDAAPPRPPPPRPLRLPRGRRVDAHREILGRRLRRPPRRAHICRGQRDRLRGAAARRGHLHHPAQRHGRHCRRAEGAAVRGREAGQLEHDVPGRDGGQLHCVDVLQHAVCVLCRRADHVLRPARDGAHRAPQLHLLPQPPPHGPLQLDLPRMRRRRRRPAVRLQHPHLRRGLVHDPEQVQPAGVPGRRGLVPARVLPPRGAGAGEQLGKVAGHQPQGVQRHGVHAEAGTRAPVDQERGGEGGGGLLRRGGGGARGRRAALRKRPLRSPWTCRTGDLDLDWTMPHTGLGAI